MLSMCMFPVRLMCVLVRLAMYLFQMSFEIVFSVEPFLAIGILTLKWFFCGMTLEMTFDMLGTLEPRETQRAFMLLLRVIGFFRIFLHHNWPLCIRLQDAFGVLCYFFGCRSFHYLS